MVSPHDKRIPLDVLILGMHHHGPQDRTITLRRLLREHPAVRAYGSTQNEKEALSIAMAGDANTIFVDPWVGPDDVVSFVEQVRRERSRIVFVLYADKPSREYLVSRAERFSHYFSFDARVPDEKTRGRLDAVLRRCEEWHREQFDYDIAISFAGPDRTHAQALASALRDAGASVFFDEFEEANLLGKDLYVHLQEIYSKRARYSAMLVSQAYSARVWTNLERQAMQERALLERGSEYVLPIRLDDTPIRGLLSTIGYASMSKGPEAVAQLICKKLWMLDPNQPKRRLGTTGPEYERL